LAIKVLRPRQVEEFTNNIKVKETSHSVAGFLKYMSGVRVEADLLILWRTSKRWSWVDGGDGEDGKGY
jgi:hypothetical protein